MVKLSPMRMPPTPFLQTERLWLCPASLSDIPALERLFNDWRIVEHLPNVPWPLPADNAVSHMTDSALAAPVKVR